jgi:hypothetical protein
MEKEMTEILSQLRELEKMELQISAVGTYPRKNGPKVQKVAKWQNDGTDRGITPARFVETAEDRHRGWQDFLADAIGGFVFDGELRPIRTAGRRIARDINDAVNRIDTRRLKHSMRHLIKKR